MPQETIRNERAIDLFLHPISEQSPSVKPFELLLCMHQNSSEVSKREWICLQEVGRQTWKHVAVQVKVFAFSILLGSGREACLPNAHLKIKNRKVIFQQREKNEGQRKIDLPSMEEKIQRTKRQSLQKKSRENQTRKTGNKFLQVKDHSYMIKISENDAVGRTEEYQNYTDHRLTNVLENHVDEIFQPFRMHVAR